MRLTFYGGAKSVTGSNYLLESEGKRILIDCGLAQGTHYAEAQNFEPFPYNPKTIDAVFVTHAHLDHTGKIPKLVRHGFRGNIYSTPPTKDFAELILADSEHILSQEAEREGKPPLYDMEDIASAMRLWHAIPYHEEVHIGGFAIALYDAGHILGSSIIKVKAEGKTIVFSGDLGNSPAEILKPTEQIPDADYCLVESTYGNRVHDDAKKTQEKLRAAIKTVIGRGGVLMIPAFAMERTQEILYQFHQLFKAHEIPEVRVFLDSPLAIKLTKVYETYSDYFNERMQEISRKSNGNIFDFPELTITESSDDSKAINDINPPKVIIAGSGMSHGGRILHHEIRYLPDPKNAILFIGYQAINSLGGKIEAGATTVRIFQEEVAVRCEKIEIGGYSAHADQPRLLAWLNAMKGHAKEIFVVQGEADSSEVLKEKIESDLGMKAAVPDPGQTVEL